MLTYLSVSFVGLWLWVQVLLDRWMRSVGEGLVVAKDGLSGVFMLKEFVALLSVLGGLF